MEDLVSIFGLRAICKVSAQCSGSDCIHYSVGRAGANSRRRCTRSACSSTCAAVPSAAISACKRPNTLRNMGSVLSLNLQILM